jgi:hypothetical protein
MAFPLPFNNGTYAAIGGSLITNASFNNILDYSGSHAWMEDDMLNTALEALMISQDCDAHHIGFVNTDTAQMCVMALNSEEPEDWFAEYRSLWEDKRWLFIPINDGMYHDGRIVDRGASTMSGTHWSLVAVDRTRKVAYFYDSFNIDLTAPSHVAARVVTKGLEQILGDGPYWWWPQERCPDQNRSNRFGASVPCLVGMRLVWTCWDNGPCGPFVWKMCQHLVRQIKGYQAHGQEHHCQLDLTSDFRLLSFRVGFHTYCIRAEIMVLIASFVSGPDSSALAQELNRAAVGDIDTIKEHQNLWFAERPQVLPDSEDSFLDPDYSESDLDTDVDMEDDEPTSSSSVVATRTDTRSV